MWSYCGHSMQCSALYCTFMAPGIYKEFCSLIVKWPTTICMFSMNCFTLQCWAQPIIKLHLPTKNKMEILYHCLISFWLWTPSTTLVVGLNWKLSHPCSNFEECKLSSFKIGVEMRTLWKLREIFFKAL